MATRPRNEGYTMKSQYIYIKLVKDGKIIINQHRVWDAKLFYSKQIEQYSGDKVKPEDKYKVSISTHEEYMKQR